MPKAKYYLHATKVDRIAIVDRPAVPNAQILLFKRRGANDNVILEKELEQDIVKVEGAITETTETLNKIGRKISARRLGKLKDALGVLADVIKEAEFNRDKRINNEKGESMTIEELAKMFDELKATLADLGKRILAIEGKAPAKEDEAIVVARAEEMKALKADVEALKHATSSVSEAIKPIQDGFAPINEKIAKFEKDIVDLSAVSERVTKIEKAVEGFNKSVETIGKKFGVKTSIDLEGAEKNESGDIFSDAVRGKTVKK